MPPQLCFAINQSNYLYSVHIQWDMTDGRDRAELDGYFFLQLYIVLMIILQVFYMPIKLHVWGRRYTAGLFTLQCFKYSLLWSVHILLAFELRTSSYSMRAFRDLLLILSPQCLFRIQECYYFVLYLQAVLVVRLRSLQGS